MGNGKLVSGCRGGCFARIADRFSSLMTAMVSSEQVSRTALCSLLLPTWRILAWPVMTADPEACKVLVASAMGEAV